MKAAFDAKRIVTNQTGLGNYGRLLVDSLSRVFPDDELLLCARSSDTLPDNVPQGPNIRYLNYSGKGGKLGAAYWRRKGVVSELKGEQVDLFHGLSGELPQGLKQAGMASVVTIHDVIFLSHPQLYSRFDRAIYDWKFRQACRDADRIVAVSETTRTEILRHLPSSEPRISVVNQGCHPRFSGTLAEAEKTSIREKYRLPSTYILSVGTLEPRKNLLVTLDALKLSGLDWPLVVVGRANRYGESVRRYAEQLGIGRQVIFAGRVPDADLPAFYQMASLFVYPSLFEGFGIPVLEALVSGVPVIAATGSCLEEAGGPDSIYIDPRKPGELADGMRAVLRSPGLAATMIENGKTYAGRFAPDEMARRMMQVYRHVIAPGTPWDK